jgi:hypothetical protein
MAKTARICCSLACGLFKNTEDYCSGTQLGTRSSSLCHSLFIFSAISFIPVSLLSSNLGLPQPQKMEFLRSSRAPFSLASHGLSRYIIQAPMTFIPAIFVAICLVTRIVTEIQRRISRSQRDAQTKNPIRIPYWIPFVGSAVSFVTDIEGTLARDR